MLKNHFINNINKFYKNVPNTIIDNIRNMTLCESNHINLFGPPQGLKEYYVYYIINHFTNVELNYKDIRPYKTNIKHKNNNIEFNLFTHTTFIEFNLYNKANYDKSIISKYLIDIIKVKNYKYDRHIVVFQNFDKLSFNAFMTLRRMMELYSHNVLFITISQNLSKIPEAIKSRCFNICCPVLENKNLSKFIKNFLKDINIENYSTANINSLIKTCNSDFNKILIKLDTDNYFTNLKNRNLSNNNNNNDKIEECISNTIVLDTDPVKYIDLLDNKIKDHLKFLKKTKNILKVILKNRDFIYKITYFNHNNQEILEKFLKILLKKKDIKYNIIINLTAETDVNIIKSSRDIFHYEKYLFNIYKLFHNIQI